MPLLPYRLSLRHTPAILRRIAGNVVEDRARECLGEDRFTLIEMVAHLADSESILFGRIREAVERDVPSFQRVDVDERAREGRFAERDLAAELDAFAVRRAETVAFLEGLSEAQFAREFVQATGRTSIQAFVACLAGHDLYHLEQASAYLPGKR